MSLQVIASKMVLAPIVLFAYNRLRHLQLTVESLQQNLLSHQSELIVFSDGAKSSVDIESVLKVRSYLTTVSGFKRVTVIEREYNYGLACSIITGVTEIIEKFGKIIVIEDDMVSSPFFLSYMNSALNMYLHDEKVVSIHGYIFPVAEELPESFFLKYTACWGWATWERGWKLFEADGQKLLQRLNEEGLTRAFDLDGAYPYTDMLKDQIKGKNNSWAIRWQASAFLNDRLTLYPGRPLIKNIGHDGTGTHPNITEHFSVKVSESLVRMERIPIEENGIAMKLLQNYFWSVRPTIAQKIWHLCLHLKLCLSKLREHRRRQLS
ncbi:MAG: glycosyltransferase family A protein [Desulfuromonadaceae bacterium]|nr:glycosyltransferase family A protein [Desulfuromonadaceae bacterium]MDD2854115.1 glycosyltransferase family A protein [Desulfuromonadaceae bacterium]